MTRSPSIRKSRLVSYLPSVLSRSKSYYQKNLPRSTRERERETANPARDRIETRDLHVRDGTDCANALLLPAYRTYLRIIFIGEVVKLSPGCRYTRNARSRSLLSRGSIGLSVFRAISILSRIVSRVVIPLLEVDRKTINVLFIESSSPPLPPHRGSNENSRFPITIHLATLEARPLNGINATSHATTRVHDIFIARQRQ